MKNTPRIRLEVEALGERVTSMLMDHAEETEELVQDGIEAALDELDIPALAKNYAEIAVSEAVSESIRTYFVYGKGKKIIDEFIQEALKP